jgi:rhodanese-related sulfurtransferase
MTPEEASQLVAEGKAILVDCREEQELRETGTAEGAVWMPLSAMLDDAPEWQKFRAELPRDKQVIMYCKVGGRSGRMSEFLCCDGFQAVNLGSFGSWRDAGLPVKPFNR